MEDGLSGFRFLEGGLNNKNSLKGDSMRIGICSKCMNKFKANFRKDAELICPKCVRKMLWNPEKFESVLDRVLRKNNWEFREMDQPDNGNLSRNRKSFHEKVMQICDEEGIDFYFTKNTLKDLLVKFDIVNKPKEEKQLEPKVFRERKDVRRRVGHRRRAKQFDRYVCR